MSIVRRARLLLGLWFPPALSCLMPMPESNSTREYVDQATLHPARKPLLPSDHTLEYKHKLPISHSFPLPDRILVYERTGPHSPPTLQSGSEIRIVVQPRHLFPETIRFPLFLDISISYRRSTASIPTLILSGKTNSRRQPRRFEFRGEKQEKHDLRDSQSALHISS